MLFRKRFAGGKGTAEKPYKIANFRHLSNIREEPDKHYKQVKDIRLPGGFAPIGTKDKPFSGVMDHNQKAIYIEQSDKDEPAVDYLFGHIDGCTIKNGWFQVYRNKER